MSKRIVRFATMAAVALILLGAVAGPLFAQSPIQAEQPGAVLGILREVVEVLVFSSLGLLILLLAFRALDLATPFSLNKEVAEDDNTAAGVVVAGMMIALGIIIHGALMSRF